MTITDNERRDRRIAEFRYLCPRAARKFLRPGLERCDLEQVAAIGLIKAAEKYDSDTRTPFEAFAWLFIIGELMHHVRDYERMIRPPRRFRQLEKQWQRAYDDLVAKLGREPRRDEIARQMNVDVNVLDQLRVYRDGAVPEALHAVQPNELRSASDPYDEREQRLLIDQALALLSDKEREIVVRVYDHGYSQSEIAEKLGYSQRHISRLHRAALRKMLPLWVHRFV